VRSFRAVLRTTHRLSHFGPLDAFYFPPPSFYVRKT
jgi:hypothetical protein